MKAVMVDRTAHHFFTCYDNEQRVYDEAGIEFVVADVKSPEEYIEVAHDADAVMSCSTKTDKYIIDHLPKVKVFSTYGVGFDQFDVPYCTEKGIVVCNNPNFGTNEVASHALALALNCIKKLTIYNDTIKNKHIWLAGDDYATDRVTTLTLGLCGFGAIARRMAYFSEHLFKEIIAYDPFLPDEVFKEAGVRRVTFDELLAQADVISVHTPLNKDTHWLFNKEAFAKAKRGLMLVSTARGGVINTDDLCDAIDAGIVRAAGLDVVDGEPITDPDARIAKYNNVTLTPHTAAESRQYCDQLQTNIATSCVKVLRGEMPPNALNGKDILARGNQRR